MSGSGKRPELGPWQRPVVIHESVSHALLLVLTWAGDLGYLGLLLVLALEVPLITLLTIGLYPKRGLGRQLGDLVKVGSVMGFLMVFVVVTSGLAAAPEVQTVERVGVIESVGLDLSALLWAVAIAALHLVALRWRAQQHADPRRQWARLALLQGAINLFTVFALILVGAVVAFVILPVLLLLDPPWRQDAPLVLAAVALRYAIALFFSRMTEADLDEIARNPYVD